MLIQDLFKFRQHIDSKELESAEASVEPIAEIGGGQEDETKDDDLFYSELTINLLTTAAHTIERWYEIQHGFGQRVFDAQQERDQEPS